jgi:lysozyme
MISNYDDFLLEQLLTESALNEKLDLNQIKNIIDKFGNKKEIKSLLINKINNTKNILTKKNLTIILIILFFANMINRNSIFSQTSTISTEIEKAATEIAKSEKISTDKVKNASLEIIKNIQNIQTSFNLNSAHASHDTKKFIKEHEKLNLKAYAIGDDMITIGYGHASPERKSKWRVGDKITMEEAEKLFDNDIIEAEDGVKRIINKWQKPTIENSLTQGMFDAMVSMAFNLGTTGLQNTNFMHLVKKGKFEKAAEKLKTTKTKSIVTKRDEKTKEKINIVVEMPGLTNRRAMEYNFFIKGLV